MRLRLIAVGDRVPGWVSDGYDDYRRRLPPHWQFSLTEIAPAKRAKPASAESYAADEGGRILAALRRADRVIALDLAGRVWSTAELAERIDGWQHQGRDLAFVIGGPDGLAETVLQRADARWSLSPLTFPHALVRVLLAEQIYRAWSILNHHPYHRA